MHHISGSVRRHNFGLEKMCRFEGEMEGGKV